MQRRRFLNFCLNLLKASLVAGVVPQAVRASVPDGPEPPALHYHPLNGRSLREIARRREHHGDGRFLNPLGVDRSGRLLKVLSWKLFHANAFEEELARQPVRTVTPSWSAPADLSVTYLKHASLMLQDAGRRLLLDPVFASPFWFMRDFTPLDLERAPLPRPDHVLITHGHYDHLDTDSLERLPRDVHVICPPGYDDIFDQLGLSNRTVLDWYDSYTDGEREITFLPSNHWTMRNPVVGPNTGLWGSYLVRTAAGPTVYLSGDTAYFDGFDQIGREFDIDLAVFNVGAYEPRWFMAQSHINPRETVAAFRQLGARRLMIMHWGTFRLGDEPVHLPPQHMQAAMDAAGVGHRLISWEHGQTVPLV
jgi:L-ascorbate metabolism protein UlaG (beta-lactamase superfamily)